MTPAQALANLISGLFTYLNWQNVANSLKNLFNYIVSVSRFTTQMFTDDLNVQIQEYGAVKYCATLAQQIGQDVKNIEGSQEACWTRLLDVILPASLKHAYTVTQHWAIDYFSPPITDLYNHERNHEERITALETWRSRYVDPEIATFARFLVDFYKGDQPAINVLNDWLAKPADFGSWAAAPVIGPIVAYLADPKHSVTRDNLSDVLAGAWSEDADKVWTDFEAMLVANT